MATYYGLNVHNWTIIHTLSIVCWIITFHSLYWYNIKLLTMHKTIKAPGNFFEGGGVREWESSEKMVGRAEGEEREIFLLDILLIKSIKIECPVFSSNAKCTVFCSFIWPVRKFAITRLTNTPASRQINTILRGRVTILSIVIHCTTPIEDKEAFLPVSITTSCK